MASPWARPDLTENAPPLPPKPAEKKHGRLIGFSPEDAAVVESAKKAIMMIISPDPRQPEGPEFRIMDDVPVGYLRLACLCSPDDWREYKLSDLSEAGEHMLGSLGGSRSRRQRTFGDLGGLLSAVFGEKADGEPNLPPGATVETIDTSDMPPEIMDKVPPGMSPVGGIMIRIGGGDNPKDD